MKQRIILLVVIIVILRCLLFGCNFKINEQEENTAEHSEVITLKWYTIANQTPKDLPMVNKAINEYIEEKLGINIEINMIPLSDYNKKLEALISSGGDFDICFSAGWTNNYILNSRKGAFYPLDELLKEEGLGVYKEVHDIFWGKVTVDGQIFGVPSLKELQPSAGVVIPKKYIDKYNIDTSKINDIYSLEDYLETIKRNENGVIPWYVTSKISLMFDFDQIVDPKLPMGIEVNEDGTSNMKVVNIYETQTMQNMLIKVHEYYKKGYINSDAAMLEEAAITDHKNRDIGAWQIETGPAQESFISDAFGQDIEYIKLWDPVVKSNPPATQCISAKSKYPKEAMKFLNLLNTDPVLRNMMNYGIEGVHYQKIDEGVIRKTVKAEDWSTLPYTIGNLFITYTLDTEPRDKWEQFKVYNDLAVKSPVFGFTPDINHLREEVMQIINIHEEFMSALTTGTVDPVKYTPKMNMKFKEAGIDLVIEEIQTQLDEWLLMNK